MIIPSDSLNLEGVDAPSRYVAVYADTRIEPQDIEYGEVDYSGFPWTPRSTPSYIRVSLHSKPDQIYDKNSSLVRHAISAEVNRWIINDRSFSAYDLLIDDSVESSLESYGIAMRDSSTGWNAKLDDDYQYINHTELYPTQRGWSFGGLYNDVGYYFSKVSNCPAVRVDFPDNNIDGYAVEFSVIIRNAAGRSLSWYFDNNTSHSVLVRFDERQSYQQITNPIYVQLRIYEWSLPYRRIRIPEIWIGYIDQWYEDKLYSLSIQKRSAFAPFSLPYSTCSLQFDNSDKLFDPTNKQGAFIALEDKQQVSLYMATLPTEEVYDIYGTRSRPIHYMPWTQIGTYYQYNNGWKTQNSGLIMKWDLVDLLGMLVDKKFDYLKLPTQEYGQAEIERVMLKTVPEWIEAVLSQLDNKFTDKYEVPEDLIDFNLNHSLYSTSWVPSLKPGTFKDVTCGDILLWICQATHTWIKVLPNGVLSFRHVDTAQEYYSPAESDINLNYDNLTQYPNLVSNDDISMIDFTIPKVDRGGHIVEGTEQSYPVYNYDQISTNTESVSNPFLVYEQEALDFANYVFQFYGGNQIKTVGRGNPFIEPGDLQYVEIVDGGYKLGRVSEMSLEISNHIMSNCKTQLICVTPSTIMNTYVILTLGDVPVNNVNYIDWFVPDNLELDASGEGVISIILVQAGQTGGHAIPTIWDPTAHLWEDQDEEPGEWLVGTSGEHGSGGYIYSFLQEHVQRGDNYRFYIGRAAKPRSTFRVDPTTGITYFDMTDDVIDGEHTICEGIASSADGQRFPNGYIEPISGKRLGRSSCTSPAPDSGDGGSGGWPVFEFLEDSETGEMLRPEDFNNRSAFAGGMGVQGANGCVIICYRAGKDNTE